MSDIDFDELDRAVNGALDGKPTTNTTTEAPTETPVVSLVEERTRIDPTSTPAPSLTSTTAQPAVLAAPAARRSSGRFMDVIHPSSDMRTSVAERPVASTVSQPNQPTPVVEIVDKPEDNSWSEPLESPFITDAKVEKRPLGGVAPSEVAVEPFDFKGLLDEPEEELLEAPEPQELVEATTSSETIDPVVTNTVTEEAKLENAEQEQPVGPTSITQQYKEQPSSTQESGAIYDTESYHQPVTQPVKKKSGWLVVVWIILLVVLGAVAGWAVYTYVLPML